MALRKSMETQNDSLKINVDNRDYSLDNAEKIERLLRSANKIKGESVDIPNANLPLSKKLSDLIKPLTEKLYEECASGKCDGDQLMDFIFLLEKAYKIAKIKNISNLNDHLSWTDVIRSDRNAKDKDTKPDDIRFALINFIQDGNIKNLNQELEKITEKSNRIFSEKISGFIKERYELKSTIENKKTDFQEEIANEIKKRNKSDTPIDFVTQLLFKHLNYLHTHERLNILFDTEFDKHDIIFFDKILSDINKRFFTKKETIESILSIQTLTKKIADTDKNTEIGLKNIINAKVKDIISIIANSNYNKKNEEEIKKTIESSFGTGFTHLIAFLKEFKKNLKEEQKAKKHSEKKEKHPKSDAEKLSSNNLVTNQKEKEKEKELTFDSKTKAISNPKICNASMFSLNSSPKKGIVDELSALSRLDEYSSDGDTSSLEILTTPRPRKKS